jgi:hypothetical protein
MGAIVIANLRCALTLAIAATVGGCGLYVPDLQDFGPRDAQIVMVQGIVKNVDCELRDAFFSLYSMNNYHTFMDHWGISVLLDLDITEKSTVSPSATWLPPPGNFLTFTLAGGISGSSQAQRIDKLHSFFTVQEVVNAGPCRERPSGPMLMENDLKLADWLFDVDTVQRTRQANFNRKGLPDDGVISHEVSFEVDTSANVTPGFKLTRVNVNDNGDFFTTSRNRVHDLQIVLGPTDQSEPGGIRRGRPGPGTAAANLAQAAAIGRAVSDALRNALRPQ